jgi:signal transduction histidine kinase
VKARGRAQFAVQLVANLVDNALNHGAGGGATVVTARKDDQPWLKVRVRMPLVA